MEDKQSTKTHSNRLSSIAVVALWSLWALSVLPLAVLLGEFGVSLGECERAAWYYAKLYGHFFVFPITFGLLAMVFLTTPLDMHRQHNSRLAIATARPCDYVLGS